MAVSAARIREIRRTITDIVRQLGSDETYRDLVDRLNDVQDELSTSHDEAGSRREDRGPDLSRRVREQRDDDQPSDDRDTDRGRSTDDQQSDRGNDRRPPQFR